MPPTAQLFSPARLQANPAAHIVQIPEAPWPSPQRTPPKGSHQRGHAQRPLDSAFFSARPRRIMVSYPRPCSRRTPDGACSPHGQGHGVHHRAGMTEPAFVDIISGGVGAGDVVKGPPAAFACRPVPNRRWPGPVLADRLKGTYNRSESPGYGHTDHSKRPSGTAASSPSARPFLQSAPPRLSPCQ